MLAKDLISFHINLVNVKRTCHSQFIFILPVPVGDIQGQHHMTLPEMNKYTFGEQYIKRIALASLHDDITRLQD